jgi:hypothetical protein
MTPASVISNPDQHHLRSVKRESPPVASLGGRHLPQDLGSLRVALLLRDQLIDGSGLDLAAPGLEQAVGGFGWRAGLDRG